MFLNFEGDWLYKRCITDISSDTILMTNQGVAIFKPYGINTDVHTPITSALYYHESGVFNKVSDSINIKTSQAYIYRYCETQHIISKHFINNSLYTGNDLFYCLNVKNVNVNKHLNAPNTATGSHVCGYDSYEADYTFDTQFINNCFKLNGFTLSYTVKGPYKSYYLKTVYYRNEYRLK